jgi:hypothetical protein
MIQSIVEETHASPARWKTTAAMLFGSGLALHLIITRFAYES